MNRFVGDKQFGTFSDGNFVLEGSATDVNSASSYGAGVQFFQARTDLYRVNHTVSTHVGNKKAGFDTTLYVLGKQVFRRGCLWELLRWYCMPLLSCLWGCQRVQRETLRSFQILGLRLALLPSFVGVRADFFRHWDCF